MTTGRNPFAPPVNTPAAAPDEPPQGPVRRPLSVWLMNALLVVEMLAFVVGMTRSSWMIAHAQQGIRAPLVLATAILVRLAFIALAVWLIVSLHRARRWSRWVGLALIVTLALYCVFRTDTTHYDNAAGYAGGQIARYVFLPALCAWWAYAFAFSAKARRYFARRVPDPA